MQQKPVPATIDVASTGTWTYDLTGGMFVGQVRANSAIGPSTLSDVIRYFEAETLDSLLTYPSISAASPGAPIPDSNVSADGVVTITWTPAAGGPPIDVNDA